MGRPNSTYALLPLFTGAALTFSGCDTGTVTDGSLLQSSVNSSISGMYLVTAIEPPAAQPGTELRISGTGFNTEVKVSIGGIQTPVVRRVRDTEIVVTVPEGNPGLTRIEVEQAGEGSSNNFVRLSTDGIPVIAGFDPGTMCKGEKFYTLDGSVREGSRECLTSEPAKQPVNDSVTDKEPVTDPDPSPAPAPAPEPGPLPPEEPKTMAACANDGQIDCIANAAFPAVKSEGLAAKLLAGTVAAGVTGSYTPDFPDAVNVRTGDTVNGAAGQLADCSANAVTGCVTTSLYQSADLTNLSAGNIKNAVTIAGVTGGYPSATHRLTNDTAIPDLIALNETASTGFFEFFDSTGARYSGNVSDATFTPDGSTKSHSHAMGIFRKVTVNGDANLVPGNIKSGVPIYGKTGSYSSGSFSNCTADGQTSCIASPAFPAADTTSSAKPANIRLGVKIAGVTGSFAGGVTMGFTNPSGGDDLIVTGATTNINFNLFVAPDTQQDHYDLYFKEGSSGGCSGDPAVGGWSLIVGNVTGTDPQSAPFSHNWSSGTAGSYYFCLVLYDSNTNADHYLTSDALSVGAAEGPCQTAISNFASQDGGCKLSGSALTSDGLVTSLVAGSPMNFATAKNYCTNLTQSGLTDWRLPTMQEMNDLNFKGVRANNILNLGLTSGSTLFWTSDRPDWCGTHRTLPLNNSTTLPNPGFQNINDNSTAYVICVRGVPSNPVSCP